MGCQNDDTFKGPETNSSRSQRTIRELTAEDVKNNKDLFAEIQKFNAPRKTTFAEKDGTGQKYKIGDLYKIDYDFSKEIIDGDFHSYTFPLLSTGTNKSPFLVFNMVFSQQKDGGYSKRVVAYKFTNEQFGGLQNDRFPMDKIDLVSFDPNQDIKLENVTTGIPDDPNGCPEGYHLVDVKIYHIGGITIYDYIYVKVEPMTPDLTEPGGSSGSGGTIIIYIPGYGPPSGNYTPGGPYAGDPGGYDGSYGGTPGNPNQGSNPGNNDDDGQNNDDPVFEDDDCLAQGGCVETTPVISPPEEEEPDEPDPCESVQEQFENNDFKNELKDLESHTDEEAETGFQQNSDGEITPATINPNLPDKVFISLNVTNQSQI